MTASAALEDQAPADAQQFVSEGVVVEVDHEGVRDRAEDRGEHRGDESDPEYVPIDLTKKAKAS